MIHAGKLRNKVSFFIEEIVRASSGDKKKEPVLLKVTRCEVIKSTLEKSEAADLERPYQVKQIKLRYFKDYQSAKTFELNGQIFEIEEAENVGEENRELVISGYKI